MAPEGTDFDNPMQRSRVRACTLHRAASLCSDGGMCMCFTFIQVNVLACVYCCSTAPATVVPGKKKVNKEYVKKPTKFKQIC